MYMYMHMYMCMYRQQIEKTVTPTGAVNMYHLVTRNHNERPYVCPDGTRTRLRPRQKSCRLL